jgi:hypothetical protein
VNKNRIFVGIFAALVIVAGGMYGINHVNACDGCAAHAKADAATTATVENADAKVSTVNSSGKACCAAGKTTATTASATDAKTVQAGAQCTSADKANATLAGAQCTSADKANAKLAGAQCSAKGELMTAEAAMAKLAKCGIDIRAYDTEMLSAKLAGTECCGTSFSQEKWASMIKSVKALDAEKADVIYANATKEKPCKGDDCSFVKVAQDLASSTEEAKKSVN